MTEGAATVTVRLIRSFEHRNIRPVVLRSLDLDMGTDDFLELVRRHVRSTSARGLLPPVRDYDYDTMKVTHKAHEAKSNNPVINVEDDDRLILKWDRTLRDNGIEHETEISFFKMTDYQAYKESLTN